MMIIDQAMPFWYEEQKLWVVNETEEWVICVVPMIFNDRITIATKDEFLRTWSAGWCYEKSPDAALAGSFASIWDPTRDQRPLGFQKIAFDTRDMSQVDLDDQQYVCLWCQRDLRIEDFAKSEANDPAICAQCGARRDNGHWFEGLTVALRYPTGMVRPDAGPTDLLSV